MMLFGLLIVAFTKADNLTGDILSVYPHFIQPIENDKHSSLTEGGINELICARKMKVGESCDNCLLYGLLLCRKLSQNDKNGYKGIKTIISTSIDNTSYEALH